MESRRLDFLVPRTLSNNIKKQVLDRCRVVPELKQLCVVAQAIKPQHTTVGGSQLTPPATNIHAGEWMHTGVKFLPDV